MRENTIAAHVLDALNNLLDQTPPDKRPGLRNLLDDGALELELLNCVVVKLIGRSVLPVYGTDGQLDHFTLSRTKVTPTAPNEAPEPNDPSTT